MIAILEKSEHNVDFHQIVDFVEASHIRQYSRRATWIAQSKALPIAADKPASLLRDDSQREAFPTVTGLDAGQDRENIIKTPALPYDSTPRVTSLDADEGNMQQQLQELTDLCTRLQMKQTEMASKINAQDLEISNLKARIKLIEDKDKGSAKLSRDDAPIKGRSLETGEEADGMDRNNEMIARHLQEYEESEAELSIGEKIDLINELVKYQDHLAKILKCQSQQSKPLSKKEQREFYMLVLKSHSGWKTNHFRGMTLEEIREKFIPVWKQIEDFVPMSSKEEAERFKRKGLRLEQGSAKRMKTSEDASEKYIKEMMQLVPMEEVYVEALQVKHPIIDWEIHSEGQRDYWKIVKLIKLTFQENLTFKRKVVVTKGRKNVGNGKRKSVGNGKKISKGKAALGKKNRAMKKETWVMVEDDVDFNKKKQVLPRVAGIVITVGGSVNVGARSKSILNVRERAGGVDNVGRNKAVRPRFVILGLRATVRWCFFD
nr:hypothetical protein [Tanacetum cinerariifolium]